MRDFHFLKQKVLLPFLTALVLSYIVLILFITIQNTAVTKENAIEQSSATQQVAASSAEQTHATQTVAQTSEQLLQMAQQMEQQLEQFTLRS